MNRAIFLDRDGTVNREVGNLRSLKQLRLLPGVTQAIRILNKKNFLVIIVTNQPVVARGWISEKQLLIINNELLKRLGKKKARIDAIYYCPHHPNANLKKYRKNCLNRKPNIGLIKKTVKDFNISLKKSYFIGDTTRDIKTAKNAGIKSILVKTGYGGMDQKYDVKPDYEVKNLSEAVSLVLRFDI